MTSPDPKGERTALRVLAVCWLALGLLVTPLSVEWWTGSEPLARGRLLMWAASALIFGLSGLSWFRSERPITLRLTLLALSGLILAPIGAEAALRLSFRIPSSPTRAPQRFGHNLLHDDYWILAGRWNTYGDKIAPQRIHPALGWSQTYVTPENPNGLNPQPLKQLTGDGRPKVLFYGDSYVAGHSAPENFIPAYMDARLKDTDVVDLGVGGYGTGQAYLLYEETSKLVERPFVIMSAMVYDLDRSTLNVRSYQKPRLKSSGQGSLAVTNLPIKTDPERFFAEAELSLSSFAWKALERWCMPLVDSLFPEKLTLNRAILEATSARAAEEDSQLLYVLFHPIQELVEADYRSTFFLEALDEAGIDVFDTREPLLAYIEEHGVPPGKLYVTGHHNDLGNKVISDALLEELHRRGFR